jgi:hypothetical protein
VKWRDCGPVMPLDAEVIDRLRRQAHAARRRLGDTYQRRVVWVIGGLRPAHFTLRRPALHSLGVHRRNSLMREASSFTRTSCFGVQKMPVAGGIATAVAGRTWVAKAFARDQCEGPRRRA